MSAPQTAARPVLVSPPYPDPEGYLRAMVIPIYNRAGEVVSSTIVDPDVYPALSKYRWSVNERGYASRMRKLSDGRNEVLKLHRVVMCCTTGDGMEIDHINRAKLDNRRANLRYATSSENRRNQDKRRQLAAWKPTVVRPRWNKRRQRWEAKFRYLGKVYYVGYFKTYDEAFAALDARRREITGHGAIPGGTA